MARLDTRRDTSHYPTARWPAGVSISHDPAAARAVIERHAEVPWVVFVSYEIPGRVIDPSAPAPLQTTLQIVMSPRHSPPDPHQWIPLQAVPHRLETYPCAMFHTMRREWRARRADQYREYMLSHCGSGMDELDARVASWVEGGAA